MKMKTIKTIVIIVLAVIAAGAGYGAYFFYAKYKDLKDNPNQIAQEESKMLVEKVGKVFELPTGEDPTIATVQDKEKLKEQNFFVNSENGDKVLVYINAKKAILYRPSTEKVIEVAPLVMETQSKTAN